MDIKYINRTFQWIKEISLSLLKYWIKNPLETPVILKFIFEKALRSPRFISRNVLTEKHTLEFSSEVLRIQELYKKYSSRFKLSDKKSYKKLDEILDDKSQLLYFLIRKTKPELVIETGVAAGRSSGFILQALHDNKKGKLISIDLPFQWYIYGTPHTLHLDSLPAGKLPGYLIPENLKKRWKLLLGDTYKELPKLISGIKKIDIFLHDSEHTEKTMMFEYQTTWPLIKKGGLLLSDDVSYNPAFNKFAKKTKHPQQIFKDLGIIIKR